MRRRLSNNSANVSCGSIWVVTSFRASFTVPVLSPSTVFSRSAKAFAKKSQST